MLGLIRGVDNITRLELSQTLNGQQVSSKHENKNLVKSQLYFFQIYQPICAYRCCFTVVLVCLT